MKPLDSADKLYFQSKDLATPFSLAAGWQDIPGAELTIPADGWYKLTYSGWIRFDSTGVYATGALKFQINGVDVPNSIRNYRLEEEHVSYNNGRVGCHVSRIFYCKKGDIFKTLAYEEAADPNITLYQHYIRFEQIR